MKSLARQISVLLLLAFCAAGALQAQAADDRNTLHAEIRQNGARLSVHAELDGQSKTFVLPAQVIKELKQLYDDLEARRGRDFASIGRRLGDLVLSPLGPMLKRAKAVRFTITEDLIGLPLDLLSFEGEPLFVQKPVTFELPSTRRPAAKTFSAEWSGLMMRDRTADPDNGVSFLATVLHNSSRVSTLRQLRHAEPVDVLLISGHGSVGDDSEPDSVSVGDDEIVARDLAHLTPRLVYLDSCQLGISLDFLHALRRAGTSYYLAPILSNEAGNSSTRTIRLFFKNLAETGSPAESLYLTRRQLYQEFKKDPPAKRLWRAYPFRLYRLS